MLFAVVIMKLSQMKIGTKVKVTALLKSQYLTQSMKRNLLSLGFTPETIVKIIRKEPFGATLELFIRGSQLCVSQEIASFIEAEYCYE